MQTKIDQLSVNPKPVGSEKLVGHDVRFRIRVGDYRVVYDIEDEVLIILVVMVGHRGVVYRDQ